MIYCPFCSSIEAVSTITASNGHLYELYCLNTKCEVFPLHYQISNNKIITYSLRVNDFWIKGHFDGSILVHKMNFNGNPFIVKISNPDFDPFKFVGKLDKLEEKLKTYTVFS